MNRLIKEASYQISLQNIEYYSKHIHLGIEILLVISGEIEVTVNQHSCTKNIIIRKKATTYNMIKYRACES